MINDPHAILLGLYRESEKVETLETTTSSIKKKLYFGKNCYILKEDINKSNHVWNLYSEYNQNVPLSNDKVLEIYTESNFNRHIKK